MRGHRGEILRLIGAGVTGVAIAGICALVGGVGRGMTLETFVVPLAIVPALVPQIMGRGRRVELASLETLLLCGGVGTAWGLAAWLDRASPGAWAIVQATLVVVTWGLLLQGLTALLTPRPRRRRGVTRATLVSLAAWLYLTWPIWLGTTFLAHGWDAPRALTSLHPLFAMNRAVLELGVWTQQPLPYALTPLGQDVAYALPGSIWSWVLTSGLASLALLSIRAMTRRSRSASRRAAVV